MKNSENKKTDSRTHSGKLLWMMGGKHGILINPQKKKLRAPLLQI